MLKCSGMRYLRNHTEMPQSAHVLASMDIFGRGSFTRSIFYSEFGSHKVTALFVYLLQRLTDAIGCCHIV